MEYNIVWTDPALFHLKEIFEFIKINDEKNAQNVVLDLYRMANTLSVFPKRNPIEPQLQNQPFEYRFLLKWNYKIIYFVENEDIVITSIFDTRKNPKKLLKGK